VTGRQRSDGRTVVSTSLTHAALVFVADEMRKSATTNESGLLQPSSHKVPL
jgi:hypothetical protein